VPTLDDDFSRVKMLMPSLWMERIVVCVLMIVE
jgi:hypothetical protein